MSVRLPHPPLPGETPFEWAERVRAYYPAAKPTAKSRRPVAAKPAKRLAVVRAVNRCGYCGSATARRGVPVACHAHADLIANDPHFAAHTEPAERFLDGALLDGLAMNGG